MSEELCQKLGYIFSNSQLLKMALTHCSSEQENNERLEFLGDAIVNFVVAEVLYEKFYTAQEGELSRWRASLINREALGQLAMGFEMGKYLFLGPGELKSGGNARLSILSCAMEAIIGAIYLDGGFIAVRERLLYWYQPLIASLNDKVTHKDPKTQLQEYIQSQYMALPVYQVISVTGQAHQQHFVVRCTVIGISESAEGKGTSRRRAEQDAAEALLRKIIK